MRPPRDDIAAPELPRDLVWLTEAPGTMPELTAAGPALVLFFDFSQLNSVRTLPYVAEWDRRYGVDGLRTVGVQAPRFPFGAEHDVVSAGLERLGVDLPVAIDPEHGLWTDYGCEGWPSLFLWGRGGGLRWFHFGEGDYLGTELAIQEELRGDDALRELPEPMAPLRDTDAPGARVAAPSEELFPGGSWERPWTVDDDGPVLAVEYAAGGAYATLAGSGEVSLSLDGTPLDAVAVEGPGLYPLAEHPRHGGHRLDIELRGPLELWSVSFAAGLP